MNDVKLEHLLTNLGTAIVDALVASDNARPMKAMAVTTVINGQLGPYLFAQAQAIRELKAQVAGLTGST